MESVFASARMPMPNLLSLASTAGFASTGGVAFGSAATAGCAATSFWPATMRPFSTAILMSPVPWAKALMPTARLPLALIWPRL